MSKQNALKFLTQIEKNPTLKQQVQAAANKEDLFKLAQESGYSFTADDMKAIAEQAESDQLNEEELEAVAGGGVKEIWCEVKETASDVWDAFVGDDC